MWDKERLLSRQERTVLVCGDEVKIYKLLLCEIDAVKDLPDGEKNYVLLSASLAEPKLTADEAKKLPADFINELLKEIMKFNGLDNAGSDAVRKN